MHAFVKMMLPNVALAFLLLAPHCVLAQDPNQALQRADRQFFIENKGQWPAEVLFLTRTGGLDAWLTTHGVVYDFYQLRETEGNAETQTRPLPDPHTRPEMERFGHVVRTQLLGSNPAPQPQGAAPTEGYYNYFIGNDEARWASNVALYKEAWVRGVYRGIDTRYYFEANSIRYDYIVAPGADPRQIRLGVEGSTATFINPQGELVFTTRFGEVTQAGLYTYQETTTGRVEVPSRFRQEDGVVSIEVGTYDPALPLVIDPLVYSTYLAGDESDYALGVALDTDGNAYVVGSTEFFNYPTTPGAYDVGWNDGSSDAFVTKLNATGSGLVYSTFLGGNGSESTVGIAVDDNGNAYVTGSSNSTNFPATSGAFDETHNGGNLDAFVAKLNAAGSGLVYSTFIGGSDIDRGNALVVDGSGNAYVAGTTESGDFPTTSGVFDGTYNGGVDGDGFATKLNATGNVLVYSTFLGGSNDDAVSDLAIDGNGNLYATGATASSNYPVTVGVFDGTHNGGNDAFVTKLNSAGSGLVYSTFVGGSSTDVAYGIAVDTNGNIYLAGSTYSSNYPTSAGAYDATFNGGTWDAFVTKLNIGGTGLVYSTFIGGGNSSDLAAALAVDGAGCVYIAGVTTYSGYPTTPGAYDESFNGYEDAFVTKLNVAGSGLMYSTFIGGFNIDNAYALAVDDNSNVYVVGYASPGGFPTTAGAYCEEDDTGPFTNAFVTKLVAENVIGQSEAATSSPPTLYPNPTAGQFTVTAAQPVAIRVFDATGRTVYASTAPQATHNFDLGNHPAGVYWVQAQTVDGAQNTQRLVLVR